MADDTIGGEKKIKPTGNPRRQMMLDAVADAQEEIYLKDGMEAVAGDPEEEEEVEDESASPNAAEEQDAEDEEKPDTEDGDSDEQPEETVDEKTVEKRLYTIKVNGKELQMTEDEIIRRAQEGLSAHEKFEEAARLRREAEQIKAQQLPEKDAVVTVGDDDRALARALQMGNEEEAAQVIAKLKARPPVQDDAARLVDERLSFRSAAEQAQKEFPKLFSDPDLAREFAAMDVNLCNAGDKRPYLERYQEIGRFLSFRHGIPLQGAKGTLEDKKQRKATLNPIRPASVRKGGSAEAEDDYDSVAAEGIHALVSTRQRPR